MSLRSELARLRARLGVRHDGPTAVAYDVPGVGDLVLVDSAWRPHAGEDVSRCKVYLHFDPRIIEGTTPSEGGARHEPSQ